jgi:hypothetical protein
MLLFAHAGLATAAVLIVQKITFPRRSEVQGRTNVKTDEQNTGIILNSEICRTWDFWTNIDFRLVMVGSLLPDIIDKPVGTFFFKDVVGNGRIYFHTLLTLIVLSAIAYGMYRKWRDSRLLTLAFGVFTHLLLDSMWLYPRTLFWPLLGNFEKSDTSGWLQDLWHWLFTEPEYYIPEIIGLTLLVIIGIYLVKQRRVGVFLKQGKLV